MKIPILIVGGLVMICLGVRDLCDGSSSGLIIGLDWHYWDRDDHPWLYWFSVLSWIVPGVLLIGYQCWCWISH